MRYNEKLAVVEGYQYKVYSDFMLRGTVAVAEDGTEKLIAGGSYLRNDLTIRKAIAAAFGHKTFRR